MIKTLLCKACMIGTCLIFCQIFPQRLVYNTDGGYFEEFRQTLADSPDSNVKKAAALKRMTFFKNTIDEKKVKIGYYVKVT